MLKNILINLIKKDITIFYVGNNGLYDSIVISVLNELKENYKWKSHDLVVGFLCKLNVCKGET